MFLSVNELIGLPGMPGTAPGVRAALNKRAGSSLELKRKRAGTKAFEYHIDCLTEQQQEVIRERHLNSLLTAEKKAVKSAVNSDLNPRVKPKHELDLMRQCPALLQRSTNNLTTLQRDIADARATLVIEVFALQNAGLSRIRAIKYICDQSQSNTLPEKLQKAAAMANARKGLRTGVSTRTLNGWVVDYERASNSAERLVLLAPGHNKGKPIEQIKWMPLFMEKYRTTKGLTVAGAYKDFKKAWKQLYADQPAMLEAIPSVYAIHRALDKLPTIVKQHGRVTGSAMRALKTYVKRDWSQMPVNGVWIGDGHSMKMKVAHPDHGRPFTPEITLVIDGRTRYVVGWSLSLAENVIAVADALRHGMQHHGIPLIYYSDNGAGQTANILDADITGIFSRLGVEHPTGIPGNPQARGIIERLNREIPARIARKFATYNGKSADRETVRMLSVDLNSAFNAQGKNKELNSRQKAAMAKLPSWRQLIDAIEDEIEDYNERHRHSELPCREDGKHYTAAEYRQLLLVDETIDRLSDIELRDMFRPQIIRTVNRGWFPLFKNEYFSQDLIQVDGEQVLVEFDIHDASSVTVRRLDGSFICTAIVNGNTHAAFPVEYVRKVAKDRHNRRMKLVEQKAEEINAELNPVLTVDNAPDFGSLIQGDISRINDDREEMFLFQSDRDEYLKVHGNKKAAI
ncbi:Mu transposase C-terminal domain-containing protein [Yersinia kristensenii]|uniref:Mu transposase C-terminal domain-containing protein n=1 Tax=Yersinia kristensenii TaxID=28152 RepID=UPI000C147D25|nr:Mu transposase C-terminal domain-containing protein [Yersinia kristensenii]MDA5524752.1 Mu transposase C-terminal domain-containing protein [Yersinia kristensenii]PHZ34828.1 transposase [Yersinia kristensenii]